MKWIVNSCDTEVIQAEVVDSIIDEGEPRSLLKDYKGNIKLRFNKYIYDTKQDAEERLRQLKTNQEEKKRRFSIFNILKK